MLQNTSKEEKGHFYNDGILGCNPVYVEVAAPRIVHLYVLLMSYIYMYSVHVLLHSSSLCSVNVLHIHVQCLCTVT